MKACLRGVLAIVGLLATLGQLTDATAQNYPSKPIRLVVPWTAGSVSDSISRLVAERAAAHLGVPVVVDNRAGAAGVIGSDSVAKAKPDGYTMLHGSVTNLVMLPLIGGNLPFDPAKDLAPVTMTGRGEMILVVPASLKVQTMAELVALAKSRPGQLSYGTMGIGSLSHFAGALFAKAASVDIRDVPYKGNNEVLLDLIGDRIQLSFDFPATSAPQITAGKLRGLMVTSPRRLQSLPNVPTAVQAGFPDLEIITWGGYFVPAGTPTDVVTRLNAGLVRALSEPEVKEKFKNWGIDAEPMTPQEFASFLAEERSRWATRAKVTGIRVAQ